MITERMQNLAGVKLEERIKWRSILNMSQGRGERAEKETLKFFQKFVPAWNKYAKREKIDIKIQSVKVVESEVDDWDGNSLINVKVQFIETGKNRRKEVYAFVSSYDDDEISWKDDIGDWTSGGDIKDMIEWYFPWEEGEY